MFTKDEFRTIFIKKGQIFQRVEKVRTEEKMTLNCTLDFLIDRFKRTDLRRKAIGFGKWKFTDFGLGFMYGLYFQNLWYSRNCYLKEECKETERKIYYQVLLSQDTGDFLL